MFSVKPNDKEDVFSEVFDADELVLRHEILLLWLFPSQENSFKSFRDEKTPGGETNGGEPEDHGTHDKQLKETALPEIPFWLKPNAD